MLEAPDRVPASHSEALLPLSLPPSSSPSPGLSFFLSQNTSAAAILFQPAVRMTAHGRDDGKALCPGSCI